MYLTEGIAREIINLNPNPDLDIIDKDVAERQFQIILEGFNHLIQPDNNFLYIADEVGLGKTYIAIGIASLLRYFSENPDNYNDLIIVPKQNLQYKWQKEINNFISKNYLQNDHIVKSILNKPAANLSKESIKHHLSSFQEEGSNYIIYRNSSFSISSENDTESNKWIEKLKEDLPEYHRTIFEKIYKKFRRDHAIIKRAFAYLLNQSLPNIDLLIVDEAHNFKHGVDGEVSTRNQIVSRLFGACNDDEILFNEFPILKEKCHPKIKKLIFLSATPINTQLIEIKRQLDCFLYDHLFKNKGDEKETEFVINSNLNKFLIRGLMTIKVNESSFSRNSYRHEHRLGNVVMKENADPQYIKDNKTALFLCLMQYKTIKELKHKNNNQFEIGMLAGFESFANNASKYEEETLQNRKENEAMDEHLISNIVDSYNKEFSDYPPHPKQDSLVTEIFNLMLHQEKALIFVRRIASVRELERKLLKKYSDHILDKIRKIKNYKKYPSLNKLIEKSELEKDYEDIERIIILLTIRILPILKKHISSLFNNDLEPSPLIESDLRELFYTITENDEIEKFQDIIKTHIKRKNINDDLKQISISLLKQKWDNLLILDDEIDEDAKVDDEDKIEEKSLYFFHRFFYNEGKNFKKRSYTKDWFELNLILINNSYKLFEIDNQLLSIDLDLDNVKTDYNKFTILRNQINLALRSKNKNDNSIKSEFMTNTFLTELLLDLAKDDFDNWITTYQGLIKKENYSRFIDELDILNEILRSIFRQGSGLIPTFIAESITAKKQNPKDEFILEMKGLLSGDFKFVLNEIQIILRDYDRIVEKNFDDKLKIRHNLIQQLPVLGISGHHKRDVRKSAIQFRMPGYPFVLIATDILKEGEDLHTYCKNIYHYGIAWNPSDMEQRTGRIDRIGSLAYNMIKQEKNSLLDKIAFQNKLQVFYPYLADTLEVNQMCKLFLGMNKFIDIFYNDLSIKIEKNSKVQIDELVDKIIPQRSGLLLSKYDINNFNTNYSKSATLNLKIIQGTSLSELQNKITSLYEILNEHNFHHLPELDINSLYIKGIMNIRNNRQGPFTISINQKKQLDQFEYNMESCLGRVQVFGSHSIRQNLDKTLNPLYLNYKIKIEITERNSFMWLKTATELDEDINITYKKLTYLIHLTDRLEERFSKKDENIDDFYN